MKILLDEHLDWRLKRLLPDADVVHLDELGWKGKGNGELLADAQAMFDVLLTPDQNIPAQQKMNEFALGIIILRAFSNARRDLEKLMPLVAEALEIIHPHEVVLIYQSEGMRLNDERQGKLQGWKYYLLVE
jgi:predicted nuclease of predicted toxin-antitoxin system